MQIFPGELKLSPGIAYGYLTYFHLRETLLLLPPSLLIRCRTFSFSIESYFAPPKEAPAKESSGGTTGYHATQGRVPAKKMNNIDEVANPTIFVVFHYFKADTAPTWWDAMSKISPDDFAKLGAAQIEAGFYNHAFCPIVGREIICIWEAKEGLSATDFQVRLLFAINFTVYPVC